MKPVYRKWILIPGIVVTAAALALGLTQMKAEPPKRESDKFDLLVEVLLLEVSSESFRIRSQGTVRPRTRTVLSAEVSGPIVSISPKFIAGGVFESDEVLMRIDPSNYTVGVAKTEALVKQRKIEFDGAEKLRSQGYRAESELASAAAALASAQAEVVRARRDLARTFIRLPYEGMVLSKDTDIGEFVNPGTKLGVAFATDLAEVRLPLTDMDLAFVEMPNAIEITETGAVDGPQVKLTAIQKGELVAWDAQIVRSEGIVDERSRVTYAVAKFADPYQLHGDGTPLPVGTFVAAEIIGSTVIDVIRIPRMALRGADQVLIITDEDKIEIRTVDVIRFDDKYAYVGGGVTAGERITTTAIAAPTNGMSVRTVATAVAERNRGDTRVLSRTVED